MGKEKDSSGGYKVLHEGPIEELTSALEVGSKHFKVPGKKLKLSLASKRLKTFKKGVTCVGCNKTATVYRVEKLEIEPKDRYHVNLYIVKDRSKRCLPPLYTMMTSDHVVSRYNNGSNGVANRQPMCLPCNRLKGSFNSLQEAKEYKKQKADKRLTNAELQTYLLNEVNKQIAYVLGRVKAGDTSIDQEAVLKRLSLKKTKLERNLRGLNKTQESLETSRDAGQEKPDGPPPCIRTTEVDLRRGDLEGGGFRLTVWKVIQCYNSARSWLGRMVKRYFKKEGRR